MEYDELQKMENEPLTIVSKEMTLQDFLDYLFWRGSASVGDYDLWDHGPIGDEESRGHPSIQDWGGVVKFQHEDTEYTIKVVEAFNQNIKAGEKVWWETKPYLSGKNPPKEWQYATSIEMTREGDPDVLRIWQTYGEPHGSWEWELEKFGNPVAINYLRLK